MSASSSSSSWGAIATDNDFANNRFRRCSIKSGSVSDPRGPILRPMRPFLDRVASPLRVRLGTDGFGVRIPGDVGGRDMGAELIE